MKDDLLMLERLVGAGRSFLVVLTKADKIGMGQRRRVLKELRSSLGDASIELLGKGASGGGGESDVSGGLPVLFFSAKTGEGKEALWEWISEHVG